MPCLTDREMAYDLLHACQRRATACLSMALECAHPHVRQVFLRSAQDGLGTHQQLTGLLQARGACVAALADSDAIRQAGLRGSYWAEGAHAGQRAVLAARWADAPAVGTRGVPVTPMRDVDPWAQRVPPPVVPPSHPEAAGDARLTMRETPDWSAPAGTTSGTATDAFRTDAARWRPPAPAAGFSPPSGIPMAGAAGSASASRAGGQGFAVNTPRMEAAAEIAAPIRPGAATATYPAPFPPQAGEGRVDFTPAHDFPEGTSFYGAPGLAMGPGAAGTVPAITSKAEAGALSAARPAAGAPVAPRTTPSASAVTTTRGASGKAAGRAPTRGTSTARATSRHSNKPQP